MVTYIISHTILKVTVVRSSSTSQSLKAAEESHKIVDGTSKTTDPSLKRSPAAERMTGALDMVGGSSLATQDHATSK